MMFHTRETLIRPQWGRVLVASLVIGTLALGAGVLEALLTSPPSTETFSAPAYADTGTGAEVSPPAVLEDLAAHCQKTPPPRFNEMLHQAAVEGDLNPRVVALTVYRESKCKASARGGVGEIGLGQIYPAVWTDTLKREGIIESVDDLYDPEINLKATVFVLNEAYERSHGKPVDALRRYNGTGKRAMRYAFYQRDKYRALWDEEVFFRPRSVESVRPESAGLSDL